MERDRGAALPRRGKAEEAAELHLKITYVLGY